MLTGVPGARDRARKMPSAEGGRESLLHPRGVSAGGAQIYQLRVGDHIGSKLRSVHFLVEGNASVKVVVLGARGDGNVE